MDKLLICFLLTVSISQVFSGSFLLLLNLENFITLVYHYTVDFFATHSLIVGELVIIPNVKDTMKAYFCYCHSLLKITV